MKAYREGRAKGLEGVPLRFTSYGEGPGPAIVCCNGVGVSTFFWKYVVRYFSTRHQVVTWDYRGHGRSGRPESISREKFTVASSVSDLFSVMDEAGVDEAVLLGHSMGVQVCLEAWRRSKKRVRGLGLICGAFGRPLDTFWNSSLSAPVFDVVYSIVNAAPRAFASGNRFLMRSRLPMIAARMGVVDRQLCRPEDLKPYFDHLSQVDPQIFFLMAGEMQRHTAIKWLDKIDAPTLIVAGEKDLFTPYHLSVQMRDRIPSAELLTIPHGSHAAIIEQPELINLRLEKWLREKVMTEAEAAEDAATATHQAHEGETAAPARKKKPTGKAKKKKSRKTASTESEAATAQAAPKKRSPKLRLVT